MDNYYLRPALYQGIIWQHEINDHVTIAIDKTGNEYEIGGRFIDVDGGQCYQLQSQWRGTPFTFNLGANCLKAVLAPQKNIRHDLIKDWR